MQHPEDEEQYIKILRIFQSDRYRHAEEDFASDLSRKNVSLAYINENRAFTDGKNITVDPAMDGLYKDIPALKKTSEALEYPKPVTEPWTALKTETRAQVVHECLHILYTPFPGYEYYDVRASSKNRYAVLRMISNIIEDCFIENAGVSVYPQLEIFLRWGRVSRIYASSPSEGTIADLFGSDPEARTDKLHDFQEELTDKEKLMYILDHMSGELLYPMFDLGKPRKDSEEYVNAVREFFFDGSISPYPGERFEYTKKIFDVIEPLIPDDKESLIEMSPLMKKLFGNYKDHSDSMQDENTLDENLQNIKIKRRLFTDLDGNMLDTQALNGEVLRFIEGSSEEFAEIKNELGHCDTYVIIPEDIGASKMHRKIKIYENHPVPDDTHSAAYRSILEKNKYIINTYNSRFASILNSEKYTVEENLLFGQNVSSRKFADPKKRYWYKVTEEQGVPDFAVMILIDGSGSMIGKKRAAAAEAAVVIDSVLRTQNIDHAIVEFRAEFEEPEVEHNVFVDFGGKPSQRYNIMRLKADGENRDGLSLCWAEKYMLSHTDSEKRIIIVISDGLPSHYPDYYMPASAWDTKNTVESIVHRGTRVIAVALEYCYNDVKDIYSEIAACDDLSRLTGQLLKIIAANLK